MLVTGIILDWTDGIVARGRTAILAQEAATLTEFAERVHAWSMTHTVGAAGFEITPRNLVDSGLAPSGAPLATPLGRTLMAVVYQRSVTNNPVVVIEAGALGPFNSPGLRRIRIGAVAETALATRLARTGLARTVNLTGRGSRVVATGELEVASATSGAVVTADGRRPVAGNFAAAWINAGQSLGATATNIIVIEQRTRL